MTDDPRYEVVEEIRTRQGHEQAAREVRQKTEQAYQSTSVDGVEVTDRFKAFLQQALSGQLPDLGDIPEVNPEVARMTAELVVLHLPEWRNPAGRKLAEPTTVTTPQAPRVADWLIARGWRWHPELEQKRWVPTPGSSGGPYDEGLHIEPDEFGQWPDPDPELFYDISDIEVAQLEDGQWAARHPRGLTFQADTKSEAYAGLVGRLRAKIEEVRDARPPA